MCYIYFNSDTLYLTYSVAFYTKLMASDLTDNFRYIIRPNNNVKAGLK